MKDSSCLYINPYGQEVFLLKYINGFFYIRCMCDNINCSHLDSVNDFNMYNIFMNIRSAITSFNQMLMRAREREIIRRQFRGRWRGKWPRRMREQMRRRQRRRI